MKVGKNSAALCPGVFPASAKVAKNSAAHCPGVSPKAPESTIRARLARGVPLALAIFPGRIAKPGPKPFGAYDELADVARLAGMPARTLQKRIDLGWPPMLALFAPRYHRFCVGFMACSECGRRDGHNAATCPAARRRP